VLDHETFTFNLTAANLGGPDTKPEWYTLYSGTQVSYSQSELSRFSVANKKEVKDLNYMVSLRMGECVSRFFQFRLIKHKFSRKSIDSSLSN
jgi:hypothetical protein